MALRIRAVSARLSRRAREGATGVHRWSLFVYYRARQAASTAAARVGVLILVAVPIAEVVAGLDVISTLTVIAPVTAVAVGVLLVAAYLFRRWRRRRRPRR